MSFPFYKGTGKKAENHIELPNYNFKKNQGDKYIPDEDLIKVANVALLLGQPLLITGDPGVGKTQFAYNLGWELNLDVYHFETKSTSVSKDLFYTYDTLRRFHDAQLKIQRNSNEYITYNALGYAILRSQPYKMVEKFLPPIIDDSSYDHIISDSINFPKIWDVPARSVVLIDEIDKAPREFPNDLLNEIENKYFKVPELGTGLEIIKASTEFSPIIIITSNSEKPLPEAFLRRCIYFNLSFPWDNLQKIIKTHIPSLSNEEIFLNLFLKLFKRIQSIGESLDKIPSISEFKDWLVYLHNRGINSKNEIIKNSKEVELSLSIMIKSHHDKHLIEPLVQSWINDLEKTG